MKNTVSPIEIQFPFPSVTDHGIHVVHELNGKPRNYLHEVSIREDDNEGTAYANDAKYSKDYGYRNDGSQVWVWRKAYPLSIGEWA